MSQTENKFKSTTIYGKFKNIDSTDGTILADANFKRDLTVQNNLIIGNEILDSSNNVVSTNGSIIFTINKIIYTLPILTLSYLNSITSNVQTQLNTINTTIQNLSGATNSNIITFTTSLNGMTTTTFNYLKNVTSDVQTQLNNIYSGNNTFSGQNTFTKPIFQTYGNNNTAFGYNALINMTSGRSVAVGNFALQTNTTGNCNVAVGTSSLAANISGHHCVSVGHNSQYMNTTGNYNTSVGADSFLSNVTGSNNTCIGYLSDVINTSSNSTAIGSGAVCTASNQVVIGTSSQSVDIHGNLWFHQNLNNISTTVFSYLSGATSNIQTQLNNIVTSISNIFTQTNVFTGTNTFRNAISFGISNLNNSVFNAYCSTFYVQGCEANFNNGLYVNNGLRINSNGCYINQGDLTVYGGNSILNNITFSGSINSITSSVFNYLSGVSSNIQSQFYNIYNGNNSYGGQNTFTNNTYFWNAITLTNTNDTLINYGNSILFNITFSGSLNSITTTTFSYLSGVTSNIQDQLNYLFAAKNPVGTVIAYAGFVNALSPAPTGYLLCDGSSQLIASYPALAALILDTYGTTSAQDRFILPNFQGMFLRGYGNQTVGGNLYNGTTIGVKVSDRTKYQGSYTQSVNTGTRTVSLNAGVGTANVISSVSVNNADVGNSINETAPVHTCVNYLIKY